MSPSTHCSLNSLKQATEFLACSRACASKVFSLRADCGRVIVYPGLKQWERPRHNIFGVCTRLAGGVCMSTSANSSASKHLTVTKIVWKIVYVTFDYLISHFFKILSLEFMANLFRDFRASVSLKVFHYRLRGKWCQYAYSRLINRRLELGRFRWRIMKFFWWITRFTIMLCTQLSHTFICRPFIGRCFVRLTTTDDKDVGRLGRSDPLERTQIYCAYSKTCNTIWLIMEQWVSNTDQQLTAYHMYPLNKRLEKIHIYPMRGYSVFWW